ncbi:Maf family protein [Mycetocola spongiae]|uniref:Maf family protein n=1 Tax=Mycetocola spongiae TaxID=2859226 RepID=UPI001CF4B57A|nr:Maf family protein [Mycetocola spongiae]UCR90362.1 Maf family nucleotide pyrophosphatase [Mycetocola spongiae]
MTLYLASTSPARLMLLRSAGIEPVIIPSHVDEPAAVRAAEALRGHLDTADMVALLARAKAEAVDRDEHGGALDGFILGGDSSFELDGIAHGKPHTAEAATERWRAQAGKTGTLYSAHWLIDHRGGSPRAAVGAVATATVTFADDLGAEEIHAYVASGEPLEVAGAFTLDSLAGPFIREISGHPSTVIGLSLPALRGSFLELGVSWPTLWNHAGL